MAVPVPDSELVKFARRLNEAADEAGLPPKHRGRQTSLAKLMKLSQKAVRKWLEGESYPSMAHASVVAGLLHVQVDWLMTGRGAKRQEERYVELKVGPTTTRMVPIVEWGHMHAMLEQQRGVDGSAVDASVKVRFLPCPVDVGERAFALRVTGISMSPRFADGELIFVDPGVPPAHGRAVIARVRASHGDQGFYVLRSYFVDGGQAYLRAENPQWPEPLQPVDDLVEVVGVVVFKGQEV